jgi:DNA-binding Lrp family transcriptional regulator
VSNAPARRTVTVETLDRQIIHGLQLEPRAPFRTIAAVLDVSEQTVARRYRRLLATGVLRVVGLLDPRALGQTNWVIRVQCRPDASLALAEALARRPDISWVALTAGGSEIVCVSRPRSDRQRDELLLQRLPRMAQVLGLSVQALLRRFSDGQPDWSGFVEPLTPAQIAELKGASPLYEEPRTFEGPMVIGSRDHPLFEVMMQDGRASYAELAAATGTSPAWAARRLGELVNDGLLYLDVEIAVAALGFHAPAFLWLTVPPGQLDDAGRTLSRQQPVAFCAAVTGSTNLALSVVCRDAGHLYEYVTSGVGTVAGVSQVEVSPTLRPIKQGGTLMHGDLLATSPPLHGHS